MAVTVRVMGVDTSLRSTGVGVVDACGSSMKAVEYITLKMSPKFKHSECLKRLNNGLIDVIERSKPSVVSVEGVFYCKNPRTSLILGEARGVVIAACAVHGLPVYEYAPRSIKQAVVGYGAAGKDQVQKMVGTLLAIREPIQEDAADALAIAITHLHNRTGCLALRTKEI